MNFSKFWHHFFAVLAPQEPNQQINQEKIFAGTFRSMIPACQKEQKKSILLVVGIHFSTKLRRSILSSYTQSTDSYLRRTIQCESQEPWSLRRNPDSPKTKKSKKWSLFLYFGISRFSNSFFSINIGLISSSRLLTDTFLICHMFDQSFLHPLMENIAVRLRLYFIVCTQ